MPAQIIAARPATPTVKSLDVGEAAIAERSVTGFFDFMKSLKSDNTFIYLQGLFERYSILESKYSRLADAHDLNLSLHADSQRNLKEVTERCVEKDSELDGLRNAKLEADRKLLLLDVLEKDKSEADRKIASLERQLQESKRAVSHLHITVKNKDGQIDALNRSLAKRKSLVSAAEAEEKKAKEELKGCQEELTLAKGELEATGAKLVKLRGFTTDMTKTPHEVIAADLDAIFTSAYDLAHQYFRADLDESVLNDPNAWLPLQNHELVKHSIPLPTTNTPAAKSMRGSALLAVLASSLARHVFQPTYLLSSASAPELTSLMLDLATTDPERESHLRSVLLSVHPTLQKDEADRAARIRKVVDYVTQHVEPLFSQPSSSPSPSQNEETTSARTTTDAVAAFRTDLEKVCTRAAELWARVQRWAVKVDVRLERQPFADAAEQWRLLPLLQISPAADRNRRASSQLSGDAASNAESGRASPSSATPEGSRQPTPTTPGSTSPGSGTLDPKDIVGVVWPSFLSVQDGELELLRAGFVLGDAQVRAVRGEGSPAGSRRGSRQSVRRSRQLTLSLPRTNGSSSGSGSFLFPGVGVGIGVGSEGG